MAIARYQKKISGSLLDRIDIYVEVPRVDYEKLADSGKSKIPRRYAHECRQHVNAS
jgi:predicted ATPase with chaperone activity